jgi:mono/diheme cytochrome c family protein
LRSRLLASSLAVALAGGVLVLAGCGGAENTLATADVEAGKTKFVQQCGGCHVMENAGTEGISGPNLDDAFGPAREQGLDETQFLGVVKRWIKIAPQSPRPGSYPVAMPQNLVTGKDADDVSAYVAKFAGLTSDSAVREISPAVRGTPPAPGDGPATPADGGAEAP